MDGEPRIIQLVIDALFKHGIDTVQIGNTSDKWYNSWECYLSTEDGDSCKMTLEWDDEGKEKTDD